MWSCGKRFILDVSKIEEKLKWNIGVDHMEVNHLWNNLQHLSMKKYRKVYKFRVIKNKIEIISVSEV